MMNLRKRIDNAATEVTRLVDDIYVNEKIKTENRKKLHMLDTWHRVIEKNIRESISQYEKCVFRTYYNSFTNRHTTELTVEECYIFIAALCTQMKKCQDGCWNE